MKRLALLAAACTIAIPAFAQTVATVNGETITQQQLDQFIGLLKDQGVPDSPQLRDQVKQEMINRLIAVQAADEAGITKKPEVQQEIELARQGIVVRALMADYLEKNPVTEKELNAEYEKIKASQAGKQEYQVRHILVEDEQTAKDLTASIKSGKVKFEDAAKEHSKDPGSGQNGGDLGWGPASNYVPEFAQAVENLEKGKISDEPVQTQFGWHIIEVQDSRDVAFPELADIKPQLEEMMRQQKLAEFQQGLVDKAKVEE